MSHKIKITLNEKKTLVKKSQDKQINKISIDLGFNEEKKKPLNNYENLLNRQENRSQKIKINSLPRKNSTVLNDRELYKLFKSNNFSKLDLHGQTLESAKKLIINYFETNIHARKQLHIIITGLGNKPNQESFFSGKIRNAFTQWIKEDSMNKLVQSYHSCKIQHGGLGAFYVKLRSIK